jgi:glutamate synthase domain-containing protein 2
MGCMATGTDVLKYLALGANVVMVGRHLLRAAYGGDAEAVALRGRMAVAVTSHSNPPPPPSNPGCRFSGPAV